MEAVFNISLISNSQDMSGAYAGGTFVVSLEMDENFPQTSPKARFLIPIQHPNVLSDGLICHKIFGRTFLVMCHFDSRWLDSGYEDDRST